MHGVVNETIELFDGQKKTLFDLKINFKKTLRRLTLRVKNEGSLNLSAPSYITISECKKFVFSQSKWIFNQLENITSNTTLFEYLNANPYVFTQGERLNVSFFKSQNNDFFVEDLSKKQIVFAYQSLDSFNELFFKYSKESLVETVKKIADEYGLAQRKISVRNQRSRWASRSSMDTLSFNWRIVLLNCEFQRYIVLHEYAHEKFMDHSVSFWIYLNRLLPNAKKFDRQLSKDGAEIFSIER